MGCNRPRVLHAGAPWKRFSYDAEAAKYRQQGAAGTYDGQRARFKGRDALNAALAYSEKLTHFGKRRSADREKIAHFAAEIAEVKDIRRCMVP